jgi:hypothetical protein
MIAVEQRRVLVQFPWRDVEGATECTRKARRTIEAQPRGNVLYLHMRKVHQLIGRYSQPAAADIGYR